MELEDDDLPELVPGKHRNQLFVPGRGVMLLLFCLCGFRMRVLWVVEWVCRGVVQDSEICSTNYVGSESRSPVNSWVNPLTVHSTAVCLVLGIRPVQQACFIRSYAYASSERRSVRIPCT